MVKVVWLCHFSNKNVRSHFSRRRGLEYLIRRLIGKPIPPAKDTAQWITNGIVECPKFQDEFEFHIVSPGYGMQQRICEYEENGVYYHIYREQSEELFEQVLNKLFPCGVRVGFTKNRSRISRIIRTINPDIVHLFGAENPNYALGLLDVPKIIPTIAQLQTLLSAPEFKTGKLISRESFEYRLSVERQLLCRADYIGASGSVYPTIIRKEIRPDAVIVRTGLALTELVDLSSIEKQFDFVYFANNISKAVDYAIEAFAIAKQRCPSIILDIVGGYSDEEKIQLNRRMSELGIRESVFFEGKLPTHDDVIKQIKKSKFALLPLKVDLISGTIRESMAAGLPVVTTITPRTPSLNEKRESVLLSEKGDFISMAENMIRLVENPEYAETIKLNAGITASERNSNESVVRQYCKAYKSCIANFQNGTPLPDELINKN